MKNSIKVRVGIKARVGIEQDMRYIHAGFGKRYKVTKWTFERKSGRILEIASYGTDYSLKALVL